MSAAIDRLKMNEYMERSTTQESIMERLQCHVQNYAWGKKGMNSEVARIYAAGHDTKIDSDKSYAEVGVNMSLGVSHFRLKTRNFIFSTI